LGNFGKAGISSESAVFDRKLHATVGLDRGFRCLGAGSSANMGALVSCTL
jgi:hypothetical protein